MCLRVDFTDELSAAADFGRRRERTDVYANCDELAGSGCVFFEEEVVCVFDACVYVYEQRGK